MLGTNLTHNVSTSQARSCCRCVARDLTTTRVRLRRVLLAVPQVVQQIVQQIASDWPEERVEACTTDIPIQNDCVHAGLSLTLYLLSTTVPCM